MTKKANKIFLLINHFGIRGLILYFKIKFVKKNIVSFYYPRSLKYPVYLRRNATDFSIFKEVILEEEYNVHLKYLPQVIIDCGANIGLTSVYFANKYPDAKIIAVEPEAKNFKMLEKNLSSYKNIHSYKKGIWSKKAYLQISDIGFGDWGFIVEEKKNDAENAIEAFSIKDILVENKIDCIDILKIDIEGSEAKIFEGDYDYWLSKTKMIIIELHDRIVRDASKIFFTAISKYEYKIYPKGQNIVCVLNQ